MDTVDFFLSWTAFCPLCPLRLNRPHCSCHSSQHSPVRGSQLGYRRATRGAVWYVIQRRLPLPNLCLAVSFLKGLDVLGQARKTVMVTSTKGGLAMVTSLMSREEPLEEPC